MNLKMSLILYFLDSLLSTTLYVVSSPIIHICVYIINKSVFIIYDGILYY